MLQPENSKLGSLVEEAEKFKIDLKIQILVLEDAVSILQASIENSIGLYNVIFLLINLGRLQRIYQL